MVPVKVTSRQGAACAAGLAASQIPPTSTAATKNRRMLVLRVSGIGWSQCSTKGCPSGAGAAMQIDLKAELYAADTEKYAKVIRDTGLKLSE
jgi:hypothetical protein